MKRVLIVSPNHHCQAHMALGYLNFFAANLAQGVSFVPLSSCQSEVVQVMHEDNIDISRQASGILDTIEHTAANAFDFLITIVDDQVTTPDEPALPANHRLRYYIPGPDFYGGGIDGLREMRESVKKALLRFIGQHLIPAPSAPAEQPEYL
jgi:protein-tyrosine-phosphatase